jgi:carbamoyl-phosphate synthase large subunit
MSSQAMSFSGEDPMNVLLTCAGRRNYLVQFFKEALGSRGQVFAADACSSAPALQDADKAFLVPRVNHPDYFDTLALICQKYQVRLLFPLNDLELPLLARQRKRFLGIGTLPVISSPTVVDLCFDKWATLQFLNSCGLTVPKTYASLIEAHRALAQGKVVYPLVVKPRWGTASIGIEYAEGEEELELSFRLVRKRLDRTFLADVSSTDPERCVLIQEHLHGQEHGLDIINDLEGRYVTTFVKRKLAMRAGETDRSVVVKNHRLEKLGKIIGQRLGHIGNLDCDVFVNEENCYVLEMNPRFGGGYPFSHLAGANLPATLIAWANEESPHPSWLAVKPNVMGAKCDRLVAMVRQPENLSLEAT